MKTRTFRGAMCMAMAAVMLTSGCQRYEDPGSATEGFRRARMAAKRDFSEWPRRFISDANDVFVDRNNLIALGVAGVASGVANNNLDDQGEAHFARTRYFTRDIDEALYVVGGPAFHFGATGVWYGFAAAGADTESMEQAWTMMTALAITGASTVTLKLINNNRTPNGKWLAWPSGHTSSSFAAASVLDEFYGPAVGIPAYALAGTVAWRMMDSGDHWASDVIFGAVLGWVVGHTVADTHKKFDLAGFQPTPWNSSDGLTTGVGLARQF